MTMQLIVKEMPALSENISSGKTDNAKNSANNCGNFQSIVLVFLPWSRKLVKFIYFSVVRINDSVDSKCGSDFNKIRDYYSSSHDSELHSRAMIQFQRLRKGKRIFRFYRECYQQDLWHKRVNQRNMVMGIVAILLHGLLKLKLDVPINPRTLLETPCVNPTINLF